MKEIRLGLLHGIDVTPYLNHRFSSNEMEQIRLGLEQGLDVSSYAKLDFNWRKMEEIRKELLNNKEDLYNKLGENEKEKIIFI